jgi:hypothetical protein
VRADADLEVRIAPLDELKEVDVAHGDAVAPDGAYPVQRAPEVTLPLPSVLRVAHARSIDEVVELDPHGVGPSHVTLHLGPSNLRQVEGGPATTRVVEGDLPVHLVHGQPLQPVEERVVEVAGYAESHMDLPSAVIPRIVGPHGDSMKDRRR